MANVNGTPGDDPLASTGDPNGDVFTANGGNDTISGGAFNDTANQNLSIDGADTTNLGGGRDSVFLSADGEGNNIRLTFVSAEVGNDNAANGNDGRLAVRVQLETGGVPGGPESVYDDELIAFGAGFGETFDVRDLNTAAQRGESFEVVVLGGSGDDTIPSLAASRPYYINGGRGNDTITGGERDDFLVGGAGDDLLSGGSGNDRFILGASNFLGTEGVRGGEGDDTLLLDSDVTAATLVDLGVGDDRVEVSRSRGPGQIQIEFASGEVGDGNTNPTVVLLFAETSSGGRQGSYQQFDDEGTTFIAAGPNAVTFDVRDATTGAQRGDQFTTVTLGTSGADGGFSFSSFQPYGGTAGADYINAGGGADTVSGGDGNDFLVGGAGDDNLNGGAGTDSFLGGGGNDTIDSVDRPSSFFAGAIAPQRDVVDAGAGNDFVTGGRLDQLTGGDGVDTLVLNFDFNGPFTTNPPPPRPAVVLLTNGSPTSLRAGDGTTIVGFENINLTLTDSNDRVNTGDVRASLNGGGGNDQLFTGAGTVEGFSFGGPAPLIGDEIFGGAGDDVIRSGAGNDTVSGGGGNDNIDTGTGDDLIIVDPSLDGSDYVSTGLGGNDTVRFEGATPAQIRLTFVSAEVGNGSAAGSSGVLAVRAQAEDSAGNLTGALSRYDDEGITFLEGTQGYTFDVRDLVSGAQRGDQFTGVVLGTSANDSLSFFPPFRASQPFYYNAGQGSDTVTAGDGSDFLVGGGGDDFLFGNGGNDTFLGGLGADAILGGDGDDTITGGANFDFIDAGNGNDTIFFNAATDEFDNVNTGVGGLDVVRVTGAAGTGQIRLTFTSAEVGNGAEVDAGTLANQDGFLAVRLQAEDSNGALTGFASRYDDEGITFASQQAGLTFDVRDLVSGVERGSQFEVVVLGTSADDGLTISPFRLNSPYYFNAGQGNDTVVGGGGADFLVGGGGNDVLVGRGGADRYIGGAGRDVFRFETASDSTTSSRDTVLQFVSGEDTLDLTGIRTGASDTVALVTSGTSTFVNIDLGNDGSIDSSIFVEGAVTTTDFVF